jgi:hypothetical protein
MAHFSIEMRTCVSLDPEFVAFLYCPIMSPNLPHSASLSSLFAGWLVLLAIALGACSSKEIQYPEDHERIRRIDQAVESLRDAYQQKNREAFRSMMLQLDQLEQLQRQAQDDFDTFHSISLEFQMERIMIEGDDIDVYVHWQGVWKKVADDEGMRQRGHARLQWAGTQSILLRGVQGDLPFGMRAKQTLSEVSPPQTTPR